MCKLPGLTSPAKGVHVDLIKLYGSMELAPLVGLSDAIVDLVSSGQHAQGQPPQGGRTHSRHFLAFGGESGRHSN